MNERMGLEEYKKKVEEWLKEISNCSIQETSRLMKLYEDDFQEFYQNKWEPSVAGAAMECGY